MYKLFAMNENGVEMLISTKVKARDIKAAMQLVINDGLTPRIERLRSSPRQIFSTQLHFHST